MEEMNRTTMRYPKLEQTIAAAECMLEHHRDEIGEENVPQVKKNLADMKDMDAEIKSIPYDSGDDGTDAENRRRYGALEAEARKLVDATAKLLWH